MFKLDVERVTESMEDKRGVSVFVQNGTSMPRGQLLTIYN